MLKLMKPGEKNFIALSNSMVRAMGIPCGAAEEGSEFKVFIGFQRMAEACLAAAGVDPFSRRGALNTLNLAFTSSDFPSLLADAINKVLVHYYGTYPSTYGYWSLPLTVSSFKDNHIVRMSLQSELPEIREHGEYQILSMKDGHFTARVKSLGGLFQITREAMVNDDLEFFRTLPANFGYMAARTMNRMSYRMLLDNPVQADGKAFYHADRKNYLEGANTALDATSLGLGLRTLREQADDMGNPMNLEPKYLLVPPALEVTAWQLCNSMSIPGQNNANVANIFRERYGLVPVVAPELGDVSLGGSDTNWFLSIDPNMFPPAFRHLGLDGKFAPYVDEKEGFHSDSTSFKVRIDFGNSPASYRGILRVKGAA